ncbi:MAG: FMN-binding negative transcriptional regulator [Saccharothrix sp.]|nr:FMN-binding negative transcriptional regulator [Saccharothrix sp.]
MFVPDLYRPPERAWCVDLIRAGPLATLVTGTAGGLFATHVPVIAAEPEPGTLRLLGHLNRANPHFAALTTGEPSVLIFTGPGGYVSPTWYPTAGPAAPTWNFAAVHARGPVRVLGDDEARHVVRSTAAVLEERFGAGWDTGSAHDHFDRILPGVGAFEMDVVELDGMFKLGQEKDRATRAEVAAALRARERAGIAELMERWDAEEGRTG